MKKLSFLFMSLVVLTSVFVACTKDEATPTTPSTSLEISVNDGDNSSGLVSNATVILSESEDLSNPITIASDSKGIAKFTNLKNIVYHIAIRKGCQNNLYGIQKTEALKSNTLNKQGVSIYGTGDLNISNPTENTYSCVLLAVINGKTTAIQSMPSVKLTPGLNGKYPMPLPLGNKTMLGIVKIVDDQFVSGSDYIENFTISCGTPATVTLN